MSLPARPLALIPEETVAAGEDGESPNASRDSWQPVHLPYATNAAHFMDRAQIFDKGFGKGMPFTVLRHHVNVRLFEQKEGLIRPRVFE